MRNWMSETWTPGKRIAGTYLGELNHPGRVVGNMHAGIIAADGTLLSFVLDHSYIDNLVDELKGVPLGALVIVECDFETAKVAEQKKLRFRVQWKRHQH